MYSLQKLTDWELTNGLKKLVGQERKILIQVIEHLEEVERRKLFAKRGYSSLFDYCTKELGYSAAAAQRRIASMRLSKQVPEIKTEIKSGALNLSSVAMADSFFRAEAKSGNNYAPEKKSELLKDLVGKTTKQVEQKLVSLSPNFVQTKEKERAVTAELTELKITFNKEQMKKLNRLKELGVSLGKLTNAELLEWALDIAINKMDPLKKAERAQKRKELKHIQTQPCTSRELPTTSVPKRKSERDIHKQSSANLLPNRNQVVAPEVSNSVTTFSKDRLAATTIIQERELGLPKKINGSSLPHRKLDAAFLNQKLRQKQNIVASISKERSRNIPSHTRHEVYLRDGGKCTFKDPLTGKRCECRTNLELDHIHPYALGGDNSAENLRLLCRVHNQLRADETYGRWDKPLNQRGGLQTSAIDRRGL